MMVSFWLHIPKPNSGGLCASDHIPRKGEKLYIKTDISPEENGVYLIEDVVYHIPPKSVHQRIDVYGRLISELPDDLSYSNWETIRIAEKYQSKERER